MPTWSTETLVNHPNFGKLVLKNENGNKKLGRSAGLQKLKDDCARTPDNRPAQATLDGSGVGTFRVSITLLYSSQRDSDLDGGATTLLDCYVAAIGRLAQVDGRVVRKLAASLKRVRRLRN